MNTETTTEPATELWLCVDCSCAVTDDDWSDVGTFDEENHVRPGLAKLPQLAAIDVDRDEYYGEKRCDCCDRLLDGYFYLYEPLRNGGDSVQNRLTSRKEVEAFRRQPVLTQPYGAYLSSDATRITTWMGEALARITWTGTPILVFGRKTMTPFRAAAIDGRTYYGRYEGPGMVLRMRVSTAAKKP